MYIYLYGPQWWGYVFHMLWYLVSLWVTRAGLVASPAVTGKGIQSVSGLSGFEPGLSLDQVQTRVQTWFNLKPDFTSEVIPGLGLDWV